ncbi:OmpA family protein [Petrimonas sp.]|uniref:OmpA family protein n=1 Tax=Petrimonas sp. TaxID=2023866 RepID=UPI003F513B30
MKRKNIYTLIIAATTLFVAFGTTTAQVNYLDQVSVENQTVSKKAGTTNIGMDVNLNNLKLNKNDMLIITPVIVSGQNEVELEPIAVKGTLRNKVLERPFEWKGKTHLAMPAENQLVRRNGTNQSLNYNATLPYADWQRDAQLLLRTEVVGCADCSEAQPDKLISQKILPDKFIPDYRMPYIVPEVEEVKARSETFSAHLNYIVGRHDLLPNFQNNAAELAKVDKIVQELKKDPDLTITDFTISGYASPEDTKERNLLLSQRRAESFARYMENKYGYTRNQFKVEWFGEDWNGLRKAVVASNLINKDAIVDIIDNVPDFDARDARLIALDNGQTYNRLLHDFYPPLRRNDYNIAFISRPFNVEEAKEIIKTRPKLLSLNEMYLVAKTYPEDSPQYKKAFDIACKTFPDAEVACINAAVGELREDNVDDALQHLQKCPDSPAAMNLMGVVYAKKGDTARAKQFFDKAIQAGNADARHNAEQLQQYMDDNM